MRRYRPGASVAGRTSYATSSAVSPNAWPALSAATFAWAICGFLANFFSSQAIVGSSGREYIHEITPSASMFLLRSASFLLTPDSLTASTVIEVIGIWTTW